MKILGINISHHPSIAFIENNKVYKLYEETRFRNDKNFDLGLDNSTLICIDEKLNFKPDIVCYASFGRDNKNHSTQIPLYVKEHETDQYIINHLQEQLEHPKYYFDQTKHHVHHAVSAFYFSPFDKAMAIVIDGGGARFQFNNAYLENESIYYIDKKNIKQLYCHYSNRKTIDVGDDTVLNYSEHAYRTFKPGYEALLSSVAVGGTLFGLIGRQIDLLNEPGKVMGLASYIGHEKNYSTLKPEQIKLAAKAQKVSFYDTCRLIEKAVKYYGIKNIVLSGGYFLNCSNNFKYVEQYPECNFFVDPVPYDAGTAVGVGLYYENYKKH